MSPLRWRQIEELCLAALERKPEERRAFLDRACVGDTAMREEVESLLAHEASSHDLLEPFESEAGKLRQRLREPLHLAPGTQLGPYLVLAELGAGGMGEVYRARDTRLDRSVAVKVLPAHLRNDLRFQQWLEREARAVSSLNHPHICTVHDIGSENGMDYIVMEYLEGETLAGRLAKGRLPLEQTLHYGIQIAGALAHAHAHGVLHRDLKPANIVLTKSGAKLLDFGLAQMCAPGLDDEGSAAPETIMGTLYYMSPEQLEGKPAGAASDIFSLGALLYEMTCGEKAFPGDSQASVIAAVLKSEPAQMSSLPGGLDRLVRACLSKDPEKRWQSVRDLVHELEWLAESGAAGIASPPRTAGKRGRWIAASLVFAVLAVAAIVSRVTMTKPASPRVVRLAIPVPNLQVTDHLGAVALSPDGTRLVYAATGPNRLYLRRLDRLRATPIAGSEGGSHPFFSPDGEWIAFFTPGKLSKVPVGGGEPQTICTRTGGFLGADWAPDGVIYIGSNAGAIQQVPASGGILQDATALEPGKGELNHTWPSLMPGGRELLFTVQTNEFQRHVVVESLQTHRRRHLTDRGTSARYVTGYLVYVRDRSLVASPFDIRRLQVTAPFVTVLENVQTDEREIGSQFALSHSGSLAYVNGVPIRRSLSWVDRQGKAIPLRMPERFYEFPRLSPDGLRIAVTVGETPRRDIWIYDLKSDAFSRLTFDGHSTASEWTPDGKRLIFSSTRDGERLNLYMQPADGAGTAERLLRSDNLQYAGSLTPNGSLLAFAQLHPRTGWDIGLLSLATDRRSRSLIELPGTQFGPRISPDGRWLAYVTNEAGGRGIYVTAFPSGNGKWQISGDGGGEVVWARSGHELFYKVGTQLMAVAIEGKTNFNAAKARLLFSRAGPTFGGVPQYDVSPDGQRFLMISDSEAAPAQLNVVINWVQELKTRSGAGFQD